MENVDHASDSTPRRIAAKYPSTAVQRAVAARAGFMSNLQK
jgi:hypothetical protein